MKVWLKSEEYRRGADAPFADLTRLDLLARACARVGGDLRSQAERARAVAARRGTGPAAVAHLLEVAEWAEDEGRRVRDLVARIRSWPATGGPGWTVSDVGHPAHRHPEAAHHAARRVVAALHASPMGDAEAIRLLARWSGNPVFAAEVAAGLGPTGVVSVLELVDARWGWPGAASARATARHLAATLATASRHHPEGVTPSRLAEAATRSPAGLRVLGALFVGRHRFSSGFLAAAVPAVVVPLRTGPRPAGRPERVLLGGGPGGRDVPLLVIDRVARDGDAARAVLGSIDLDGLLVGGHGDAGFAVARLLEAGTRPSIRAGELTSAVAVDGPRARHGAGDLRAAASNLARLTRWMASARPPVLPIGVELSVDRILGPWIGSVRGPGLAGTSVRHARLNERGARRLLGAGMRWDGVQDRLLDRAWRWAAGESDHLAARRRPGPGFDAVGSVLGIVTIAAHDAEAAAAVDGDRRRAAHRRVWGQVQSAALRFAPPAVRGPVGALGGPLRDRVLPDTDLEVEHWRDDRDRRVDGEALAVEQVIVQALHARRPGMLPDVVTRGGGVRPLWDLSPDEWARYQRWRADLGGRGPAPVQLAVERFLAEGRAPRPAPPPPAG